MVAAYAGAASAQSFGAPFNHELINTGPVVPNPNATDHLAPFGGYANPNISYFTAIGVTLDWAGPMNAVHMSVIPKGPHQGKLLVWGATNGFIGSPVVLRSPGSGPTLASGEYHVCAAWSIIDPSDAPSGPRFRNFLLPLETSTPPVPLSQPFHFASLFCAGQAWSPFGDLIVAGGTQFGIPTLQGPKFTFAFNPSLSTRGWLSSPGTPLYPGQVGLWEPGPQLEHDRFYPTATLTSRMQRLGGGAQPAREVILVAGGSVDDSSTDPIVNYSWNSYEALIVSQEAQLFSPGISKDTFQGSSWWFGPGTSTSTVEEDWLEDYPRMHLLSTGEVLFSGYAPRWAKVDHDAAPGVWVKQAPAAYWDAPRHDGASVLLPNSGGLHDMVVRMGGSDTTTYGMPTEGTVASIEAFVSAPPGGAWAPAGDLPNTFPSGAPKGRYLMNVVLLPDGSILVLGGAARDATSGDVPVLNPLLYENGTWSILAQNPIQSIRDYHSTAALLPDGRVFIGGGNNRNWDYEVFTPDYFELPRPENVRLSATQTYLPTMNAWQVDYAATLTVTCDALQPMESIAKIVLMAPGATTHHSDMHMRYVELEVVSQPKPFSINVRAPLHDKLAPRGNYMMFVVTNVGAVSEALWVALR